MPPPLRIPQTGPQCHQEGLSSFPFLGQDSPERLLLRHGVIDAIPTRRCGNPGGKNVVRASSGLQNHKSMDPPLPLTVLVCICRFWYDVAKQNGVDFLLACFSKRCVDSSHGACFEFCL